MERASLQTSTFWGQFLLFPRGKGRAAFGVPWDCAPLSRDPPPPQASFDSVSQGALWVPRLEGASPEGHRALQEQEAAQGL